MLPARPNAAHQSIASFVKEHEDASIATTNYDCCMDRALTDGGLQFDYSVDFANSKSVSNGTKAIPLIKLHGSLNWFYCETCQHVYRLDIEQTVSDYLEDRGLYPVIGVCKDCGGQRRGLLVPPLAMKFDVAPPLNPLLQRADQLFSNADLLVVVGFSFAEADLYLTRMLSKAMQNRTDTRLLIIDPQFEVVEKIKRRLSIRIPYFDEDRICWAAQNCAEFLPKFLAGELLNTGESANEASVAANGRADASPSNN
jgi:NAD-dependent SIR2 family protein deacetylase